MTLHCFRISMSALTHAASAGLPDSVRQASPLLHIATSVQCRAHTLMFAARPMSSSILPKPKQAKPDTQSEVVLQSCDSSCVPLLAAGAPPLPPLAPLPAVIEPPAPAPPPLGFLPSSSPEHAHNVNPNAKPT